MKMIDSILSVILSPDVVGLVILVATIPVVISQSQRENKSKSSNS